MYELASRWLRLDPLTFGLVAPLGLFGLLVLVWQRRCVFLPVVAFGVCASVVAFFVMERFRFPILPALIPAVFPGVEALARALKDRAHRRVAGLAGLLLACFLLVHLPLVPAQQRAGDQAIAHYHFGRAESELSRSELGSGRSREGAQRSIAAERHLVRAIELDDRILPARVELAVVLLRRGTALFAAGRPVEARASYRLSRAALATAFEHPSAGAFAEILDQADRELMPLLELNDSRAVAAIESGPRPPGAEPR